MYDYLRFAFYMALKRHVNPRFLAHMPNKAVAILITLPATGPLALFGVLFDLNNRVNFWMAVAASAVIVYVVTYVILLFWRER
jgi:hypothetical protein